MYFYGRCVSFQYYTSSIYNSYACDVIAGDGCTTDGEPHDFSSRYTAGTEGVSPVNHRYMVTVEMMFFLAMHVDIIMGLLVHLHTGIWHRHM